MRRLMRAVLLLLATASFLLAVLVALLWARSHRATDYLGWSVSGRAIHGARTFPGGLSYSRMWWTTSVDNQADGERPGTWRRSRGPVEPRRPEAHDALGFGLTVWRGPGYSTLSCSVPSWCALLGCSALPVAAALASVRRRRRVSGGCPSCGYDLRATPDRCPECGTDAATGPPHNQPLQRTGDAGGYSGRHSGRHVAGR